MLTERSHLSGEFFLQEFVCNTNTARRWNEKAVILKDVITEALWEGLLLENLHLSSAKRQFFSEQ